MLMATGGSALADAKKITCYELDGMSILYKDSGEGDYKNPDPTREKRYGWFVIKELDRFEKERKEAMFEIGCSRLGCSLLGTGVRGRP